MGVEVLELYGCPLPERIDKAFHETLGRAYCPFRRYHCDQVDAAAGGDRAAIPHGVCLVRDPEYDAKPVPVCASRMLADGVVLEDARKLLHRGGEGCAIYLLPGVQIPRAGLVDYMMVSVREGLPVDFLGLDLHPVNPSGPVWTWRDRALAARGDGDVPKDAGADAHFAPPIELDWRDSARDLLSNLHHKLGFFERLGKRLVVAVPDALATFMMEEFAFDMVPRSHGRESLRLHSYAFGAGDSDEPARGDESAPGAPCVYPTPRLVSHVLLDSVQVAMALGLQASVHEELAQVMIQFSGRLTPEYQWHPADGDT